MFPTGPLARVDSPQTRTSASSGVHYDWTGADQLLKRQDAISELLQQKFAAGYDGDIKKGIEAGHRIRDIKASMAGIRPVRLASESAEHTVDDDSGSLHWHEPGAPEPEAPPIKKDAEAAVNNAAAPGQFRDMKARTRPGAENAQFGIA